MSKETNENQARLIHSEVYSAEQRAKFLVEGYDASIGTDLRLNALRGWLMILQANPLHNNPEAVSATERLIDKAQKLSGRSRERLLATAAYVLEGIYEVKEVAAENDFLPKEIDRIDITTSWGSPQYKAYGQVFKALGFKPATVLRTNDHGMRVVETTYLSPYFANSDSRVAIIELVQRSNDVTLFAEVQPTA